MPADWYGTSEALRIAENLLLFQRNVGGWQKDTEMADVLTDAEKTNLIAAKAITTVATIDNNATISQIRFRARVYNATKQDRYKDSAIKGIDYLLTAQYPNGGFPQFHPNFSGYFGHITSNDNAMVNVLNLMRDLVIDPSFAFVDTPSIERSKWGPSC